ncbi:MAG: type II toxin-antitoxin system RelE/ParE family toxin [Bacteroidales bacterium]|nr:type II toxin-antitoxin system RelE/ParE family toxin [Bacteroidales bacterium]
MIVVYSKALEKKIEKMTDKVAIKRLLVLIKLLKEAKSLREIPDVLPIKGAPGLYRITTGDYRLIIEPVKHEVIVILLIDYRKRNEKTYKGLN